jgi:drug/metabolite transporter (DMT)-like permease
MCWACTTILLRFLGNRLDAFLVNGLRAAMSLLLIIPAMLITGHSGDFASLDWKSIVYLTSSVALGGVVGDALYVTSLKVLGVHRAFPITNSYPLFTMLFSAILLGERVTWLMLVGMTLVMLGVYSVARPKKATIQAEEPTPKRQLVRGVLLGLATAAIWGVTTVILSMGLKGINTLVANTIRVPVVVLLSLFAAGRRGHLGEIKAIRWPTLRLLLLAGLFGWGLGGTLYATALQLAGPSRTAIISATAPLFAVPLSMVFLQEKPTRNTLIGTVLSIAGIALVI